MPNDSNEFANAPQDQIPTNFVLAYLREEFPGDPLAGTPYWIPAPDQTAPAGNANDLWASFSDQPPAQAPSNAPWAVNDIPSSGSLFAAPTSFGAAAQQRAGDQWASFPDWPPMQTQLGGNADPFATYADPWHFAASQAPSNAPWTINEVPPAGALFAAPKSFGDFASQPMGDSWAAFPNWPPAPVTDTGEPVPFGGWQMLRNDALGRSAMPLASGANTGSDFLAPQPPAFDELGLLRNDALSRRVATPAALSPASVPPRQPNLTGEQQRIFNERTDPRTGYDPYANQIVHGLSLHWDDDAIAPLVSLANGTRTEDELAVRREARKLFEEEHPAAAFVAELAGEIATTAVLARFIGPANASLVAGTIAGAGRHPEDRLGGGWTGFWSSLFSYPMANVIVGRIASYLKKVEVPHNFANEKAFKEWAELTVDAILRPIFGRGLNALPKEPVNKGNENISSGYAAPGDESYAP